VPDEIASKVLDKVVATIDGSELPSDLSSFKLKIASFIEHRVTSVSDVDSADAFDLADGVHLSVVEDVFVDLKLSDGDADLETNQSCEHGVTQSPWTQLIPSFHDYLVVNVCWTSIEQGKELLVDREGFECLDSVWHVVV
jgi:hypothetical protein